MSHPIKSSKSLKLRKFCIAQTHNHTFWILFSFISVPLRLAWWFAAFLLDGPADDFVKEVSPQFFCFNNYFEQPLQASKHLFLAFSFFAFSIVKNIIWIHSCMHEYACHTGWLAAAKNMLRKCASNISTSVGQNQFHMHSVEWQVQVPTTICFSRFTTATLIKSSSRNIPVHADATNTKLHGRHNLCCRRVQRKIEDNHFVVCHLNDASEQKHNIAFLESPSAEI